MSHLTAFITGCAVTGLVAFLWLRGFLCFGDLPPGYGGQTPPDISLKNEPLPPVPVPSVPPAPDDNLPLPVKKQLEQQETAFQQLKTQFDQQRLTSEQIKTQLDQQRNQTERLLTEMQEQQRSLMVLNAQQQARPLDQSAQIQVGIMGLLVGIVLSLIVGGGIILLIAIAVLAQPQRRSSNARYLGQPINVPWPYTLYRDRPEFLPPDNQPKPPR